MKKILILFLGILMMATLGNETKAQSRRPEYLAGSKPRPPSNSRLPGSRRPISMSRRALALQTIGWEIGGNLGTAYSLTDASGISIDRRPSFLNTQWNTISLNAGIFGKYRFHEYFALNTSFNYARVSGADSIAGRARGFYFNNTIIEVAATYEVYVPMNSLNFPLEVYGFFGLAGFYHNPNLTVPNPAPADFTWDQYSSFQPAIPLGFGLNYSFNRQLKIGYEIGWRKTFFDYLDGFTRPASTGSDSYYFGSFKVSYFMPQAGRRW